MAKQQLKTKGKDSERLAPEERERREEAWKAAVKVLKAGAVRTGIPDLGLEHEHHLYGRSKHNANE